uniref:Calponin-homology (CH) domain-containing protein n=1 Tax=Rodentolepis nana TaxID=102285 RepID=A0A0R3TNS1_RODNA
LSFIHFNHLADKDSNGIKSLLDYHQRSDVQHLVIIENWCLSLQDAKLKAGVHRKEKVEHSLGILVECLAHLAGIWNLPGIPRSIALPIENTTFSIGLIYNHLAALICFAESQGGCVGHVLPEFLMAYEDYKEWIQCGRPGGLEGDFKLNMPNESISETKVITPVIFSPSDHGETVYRFPAATPMDKITFERVSKVAWTSLFLQLLKALVVGQGAEARLLQWVNKSVKSSWTRLCEVNKQTEKPMQYALHPPKVTNFGEDFASGLALVTVIANYAPFLIDELFLQLNLNPQSQEHKFHNAVQIVKSFRILQVDVSITAEEICNPNEVQMILVLSNLYRTLPDYQIQSEIKLTGKLNAYVLEYLTLSNPTNRKLTYSCFYVGKDAKSFYFNKESNKKQTYEMELLANGRSTLEIGYLVQKACETEAWLIMVSKMDAQATKGLRMTFRLIGRAAEIHSEEVFTFKTFCYQPVVKVLQICNPFKNEGVFSVRVMESSPCSNRLRGFTCHTKEAKFSQSSQTSLEVAFHPFSVDNYSGRLIFSKENRDEFSVELQGHSRYPNLEDLPNIETYRLALPIENDRHLTLQLPLKNNLRCEAIKWVANYCISSVESGKEDAIESRSEVASKFLMLNQFEQLSFRKRIRFDVRCDSEQFRAPSYIDVDFKKEEGTYS